MKYPLILVTLALGILVLGGCSAGSSDVNQADEANEVEAVEQGEELNQVDEVSEANEITSTEETNEVEQVEQVEEPVQDNEIEQANGTEVVDEAGQAVEVEEATRADLSNEVVETSEANEVKESNQVEEANEAEETSQAEEVNEVVTTEMGLANVILVEARGDPGSYTFSVGVASPDEGCQQYADWWEVLNEDGELIYRRVLLHSHVGEQPFVRSGGPVEIAADQVVWVRAHMNTSGYGVVVFKGSVQSGFQEAELSPEFALEAANVSPLPNGCDF